MVNITIGYRGDLLLVTHVDSWTRLCHNEQWHYDVVIVNKKKTVTGTYYLFIANRNCIPYHFWNVLLEIGVYWFVRLYAEIIHELFRELKRVDYLLYMGTTIV